MSVLAKRLELEATERIQLIYRLLSKQLFSRNCKRCFYKLVNIAIDIYIERQSAARHSPYAHVIEEGTLFCLLKS